MLKWLGREGDRGLVGRGGTPGPLFLRMGCLSGFGRLHWGGLRPFIEGIPHDARPQHIDCDHHHGIDLELGEFLTFMIAMIAYTQ